MGLHLSFFLILVSLPVILAQEIRHAKIVVDGTTAVAEIDDNFICATLDWWPHTKCDYNQCPWGNASVTNLDLSHPLLAKAIQAFKHLRIRIGGSLQDRVLYNIGDLKSPCHPFRKMKDGLFGYSKGCLYMRRWDELNHFFSKTGVIVTFGLNALYGRHQIRRGAWEGDWDPSNTIDLMKYTISKGYQINSWEFGNELSGTGVGASVRAELYGKDLIKLKDIMNELYKKSHSRPSLIAPGGFVDPKWYTTLLDVSGSNVLNIVTHHIYNLGAGNDPNLVSKILDPSHLSKISDTFSNLQQIIKKHGPWASAWVGESGGAYNSGGRHVSDTFVNSFWYLDQLGMASKYNTKVYCRQSLIGGSYGLLNTTTFVPRPDYYSSLLWHRLMGKGVLAVDAYASSYLRSYAHCSKGRAGITVLLINLSNQTHYIINVGNHMNFDFHADGKKIELENSIMHNLKRTVSWVGRKASDEPLYREEYHLTPKDGFLRSEISVLNGVPLKLTDEGEIPKLDPVLNDVNSPLYIVPRSIAFIVFPNFDAPACV
ncbi:heparanase-like protein 1 [Corylus avellana]|uniref:heparanase-like protein 1 n=1 Tax=Corylus avellana TaxID=13451 RepID=UPI00286D14C1|nr:heparanase-like protein 1 [Corylus avellana]XP_059442254.1 heparanase-like protein 1 [Corylus avellana]